ncbi:MAG: Gfo/Idh/MocA family protein, partial [Verrucomicrobiota bacterium]
MTPIAIFPPVPASRPDAGVTRRRFARRLSLGAGALAFPALVRGQNLNQRLDVVAIGVGGRGAGNLAEVARTENIVAVCDVAAAALDGAVARHPGARRYTDFRRLYDAEKRFDAVIVSTCEHTHAFATLPALRLGKHVYCEKPLAHTAWECRQLRLWAEKKGV